MHIIVDSGSDVTREKAAQWGVTVLPLRTIFGKEEYLDGVTLDHRAFYEKLVETDVMPSTSQVPPYDYEKAFRAVAETGETALCLTISSKLSGCYQSASIAAAAYPEHITVVDTENVSIGAQLLVERAVALRAEGLDAAEIAERLEREKELVRVVALFDTLEYLKRGGRLSSAAAFAGGLLNIKPVISVVDGEVVILGKARGSKNANNLLSSLVEKEGGINFDMPYRLAYTGLSDALLQKYVQDSAPLYAGKAEELPVCTIGSAIGTHAGPGAIAAAFFVRPGA